jgi:hypothetical protein
MSLTHLTTALNGYAAKLTGVALDAVQSDPNVEYIEQDAMFSSDDDSTLSTTGPANPPPGNISQPKPKIGHYDHGFRVDIFVLGETCLCAG